MDYAANPILRNEVVTLEPLSPSHVDDLAAAVRDGELWKAWYALIAAPERTVEPQALADGWARFARADAERASATFPALVASRKLDACEAVAEAP